MGGDEGGWGGWGGMGGDGEGGLKNQKSHLNLQTKQKPHLPAIIWKVYHKKNTSNKHYLHVNTGAINCSQVTPGLLSRVSTGHASDKSSKGYFTLVILLKQNIAILLSLQPDNGHFSPGPMQHEAHKNRKTEVEQKKKLFKLIFVLQKTCSGSAKD